MPSSVTCAYRIEAVGSECSACGQRSVYDVIGPDEVPLGMRFDRDVAQCMANDLNRAFEFGRQYALEDKRDAR